MKTSTNSYFLQRVTGFLLIPISFWILFAAIPAVGMIMSKDIEKQELALEVLFGSTFSTAMLITFIMCGMYHGFLGIKNIICDYVVCDSGKKLFNLVISAISFFTALLGVLLIIEFHIQMIMEDDAAEDMSIVSTEENDSESEIMQEPEPVEKTPTPAPKATLNKKQKNK